MYTKPKAKPDEEKEPEKEPEKEKEPEFKAPKPRKPRRSFGRKKKPKPEEKPGLYAAGQRWIYKRKAVVIDAYDEKNKLIYFHDEKSDDDHAKNIYEVSKYLKTYLGMKGAEEDWGDNPPLSDDPEPMPATPKKEQPEESKAWPGEEEDQ